MIDAGDITGKNETFISNLISYFKDYFTQYQKQPYISKILLTHGHHDHFGGLFDVIQCLK
jgi:glyoxylase-like metal-dependent hydrolase (beta-lactamase superfamily II)